MIKKIGSPRLQKSIISLLLFFPSIVETETLVKYLQKAALALLP